MQDFFIPVFERLGFKHFQMDLVKGYDHPDSYVIGLSYKFDAYRYEDTKNLLNKIIEPILDSPHNRDIESRHKAEIEKLNKEIERLKQFETYFKLEKEMRGAKNDTSN